jgi:outer membrane protein OmpA-like peptidoglycan-associated protein
MTWKLILTAGVLLFVVAGCAPSSHFGVADKAMTCPSELDETEAVIANAEKSEGARYCPEKILRARELAREGAEIFWAGCPCEAQAILEEARTLAKEAEACGPAKKETPPPPPAAEDTDGDGIIDANDKCPNTPTGATVNAEGCWVIPAVLFDTDETEISGIYRSGVDSVVDVMRGNPGVKLEIQGHTDSQGSAAYNQGLSERRAEAVKAYMVSSGISSDRLSTEGFGASRQAASNDNAAGMAKNRRAELIPVQ